jgi:hypothetical protein
VIFKATKQHATNLAKFVTIYKSLLLVQRRANGGKEKSADSFLAGLIGGYLVFGDRTAINEQVCDHYSAYLSTSLTIIPSRLSCTSALESLRHSFPERSQPQLPIPMHPLRLRLNPSLLIRESFRFLLRCRGVRLCGYSSTSRKRCSLAWPIRCNICIETRRLGAISRRCCGTTNRQYCACII